MPPVIYVPSRIGEGHFTDFQSPAAGATDNGKIWAWNSATSKFEPIAIPSTSPGGSSGQVQYNNGGGFGGHSGFVYDGAGIVTVSTALVVGAIRPAINSTTALQLQNASGTAIVTVDTTGKVVSIAGKLSISGSDSDNTTIGTVLSISSYNGGSTKYGLVGSLYGNGASSAPSFVGLYGIVLSSGGAYSASSYTGVSGNINYQASSGTLSNANGISAQVSKNSTATITNANGIIVQSTSSSGGGSIGTVCGLRIESQSAGTTNYSIYTNAGDIRLMSSNSDKIGFHGVTPVTRQLLATGAGRTVDDVITFLQNLGLARQS